MIQLAARFLTRYSHLNWALADQAMVSGANFLTAILLARYLGIEEFGRFALAWMVVLFAGAIQHAAINAPMMSIGPKQAEADVPAYYGAVMVQQMVFEIATFAFVWFGAVLSAAVFPEWRIAEFALPLACVAVAAQFQDFLRRYLFTRSRGMNAFLIDGIRYLGQLAVLVWLFQVTPMDAVKALWVFTAAATVATLCGGFLVEGTAWSREMFRNVASRHWNFGKWLTASALMQWISGNIYILIAGVLLGASAVGALRAAKTLIGATHVLFMGLENVMPVRATEHLRDGGRHALIVYLRRVGLVGGLATASVAVIAAAAPEFWLDLIFGDQYRDYGYILRWYAVIQLAIFFCLLLRVGLRTLERTRPIFLSSFLASAVATIGAYPLLSWLGLTGAVIGMLLSQAIFAGVLMAAFIASVRGPFGRRGLVVALLGNDGSGKTTVIERIEADLASPFCGTKTYHLRPFWGKPVPPDRAGNPHSHPPRGLFGSLAKIAWMWAGYNVGYLVDVYPRLRRSTLVLFDRYYHDILVDPIRFRYGGPMWLARLVGKFVPRPDLWIVLTAPVETLRSRKEEVSPEETARQRNAYLEVARRLPNATIVDTSRPLEDVMAVIERAISGHMADRKAAGPEPDKALQWVG